MAKNPLQKLLDVGIQFSEMSRKQAEAAVKQMVKAGAVRRSEAEATVQAMLDRSRETAMAIGDSIQQEVSRQLGWLAKRVDELEDQLESMVGRFSPPGSADAEPDGLGDGSAKEVTVRAGDVEFTARVRIDTPKEVEYYRHGGILPFVLRQLLERT